jgi:hypothetical protein
MHVLIYQQYSIIHTNDTFTVKSKFKPKFW